LPLCWALCATNYENNPFAAIICLEIPIREREQNLTKDDLVELYQIYCYAKNMISKHKWPAKIISGYNPKLIESSKEVYNEFDTKSNYQETRNEIFDLLTERNLEIKINVQFKDNYRIDIKDKNAGILLFSKNDKNENGDLKGRFFLKENALKPQFKELISVSVDKWRNMQEKDKNIEADLITRTMLKSHFKI